MSEQRMSIVEMISLCHLVTGIEKMQCQIIGHEVRKEYEYIDFYDLLERNPRPRHRIRKFMGIWKYLY